MPPRRRAAAAVFAPVAADPGPRRRPASLLGCALGLGLALVLVPAALVLPRPAAAAGVEPLDRVQLHRNASRGVPYLPLGTPADPPGEPALTMRAVATVELDGKPLPNAYAGLRPIDVDGDGAFELVHYNGFNFMQVWSQDGRRLWRVANPAGRLHDVKAGTHRDGIAVLDLDGDGKQDVAQCWAQGGRRLLVARRGLDGTVIRSAPLAGTPAQECQLAAFRMADTGSVEILVAQTLTGPDRAACPRNFVGNWVKTVAFDLQLRKLWERPTCDAGHAAWPVDADQDGLAEAVFVGKYLLRADGSLKCRLEGWPAADHVDSLAVAELDPVRPGLEAAAVGLTGAALFSAEDCRQIWRIPTRTLRNPQHLALARLDPTQTAPQIVIDEKGVVVDWATAVVSPQGQILARQQNDVMPMQNADLDGARGVDEGVGSWGRVIDRYGSLRLDRGWYWDLKGTKVAETTAGLYPEDYDRWQAFPLVVDLDRDGRDEIVQWGQSLIVVGKAVLPPDPPPPPPPPSP